MSFHRHITKCHKKVTRQHVSVTHSREGQPFG